MAQKFQGEYYYDDFFQMDHSNFNVLIIELSKKQT